MSFSARISLSQNRALLAISLLPVKSFETPKHPLASARNLLFHIVKYSFTL